MTIIFTVLLVVLCLWFSFTDITTRRISNSITHPVFIFLLICRLFESSFLWGLIPAALLMMLFLINPNSIGAGDIKLLAIIGLCLGLSSTIPVIFGMCVSALIYLILRRILSRPQMMSIPLAPFMTVGVLFSILGEITM